MSYSSIAAAAQDQALRLRIAACVAQEAPDDPRHPIPHADAIQWQCCAEPGWGAAWDSAIAAEVENPGADPAVISDGMILTAVQLRLGAAT